MAAIDIEARKLGHTRSVCRRSYVQPSVMEHNLEFPRNPRYPVCWRGYTDMARGGSRTPREEQRVSGQLSEHIVVDWPRSIGFFGALGAAAALELVPLPIAIFVASVPFLKLLNRPDASTPRTFFSHLVDGAAKPVGGDSEGTVRWAPRPHARRIYPVRSQVRSRSRRGRQ